MANEAIQLVQTSKGKGLRAKKKILEREYILSFERNFVNYSNNKTLRIDENLHQISTDQEAIENFVNHSCNANAYIDFDSLTLRAIRDIKTGEEITYNYFTTDWDKEDVFDCLCGANKCYKKISGFRSLPLEDQIRLKKYLSGYLLKKLEKIISMKPAKNLKKVKRSEAVTI